MARVTNETLAAELKNVVEQMKIQNGRTFDNSKEIAKIKGVGTAITFILSALAVVGVFLGITK